MRTEYLSAIKRFEGFTQKAQPDYAQDSNGYGTKARFPGETIDRAEAERRFAEEIGRARDAVRRFAPDLDEGTAAALTSLTFNAGTSWMNAGLGTMIKSGEIEGAKDVFVQYVNAGGQPLPGLVSRRAEEVEWIGTGRVPAGPEGTFSVATVTDAKAALVVDTAQSPAIEAALPRAAEINSETTASGVSQMDPRGVLELGGAAFLEIVMAVLAYSHRWEKGRRDGGDNSQGA